MKALRLLSLALVLTAGASAALAKPIKLARHPDYSAGRIVFSYLGDLWVVNEDGAKAVEVLKQELKKGTGAGRERPEVALASKPPIRHSRCDAGPVGSGV